MDAGWGKYKGEFIFETDENTISTNHITEQQMYDLKKIHFLTNLFWSMGVGKSLLKIGQLFKISPLDVIIRLAQDQNSPLFKNILSPLENEFKNEWFDNERVNQLL